MTQKTAAVTAYEAITANRQRVGNPKSASNLDVHHSTNLLKTDDNCKDIEKVFQYFQYNVGTSLDCATRTGVLRNSITWYIADLQKLKMLGVVRRDKDPTTGFKANFYSADPRLWRKLVFVQLSLFDDREG